MASQILVCDGVINPATLVCDTGFYSLSLQDLAVNSGLTLSPEDKTELSGFVILALVIAYGFRLLRKSVLPQS